MNNTATQLSNKLKLVQAGWSSLTIKAFEHTQTSEKSDAYCTFILKPMPHKISSFEVTGISLDVMDDADIVKEFYSAFEDAWKQANEACRRELASLTEKVSHGKAANDLQVSSNPREVVGFSPRKSVKIVITPGIHKILSASECSDPIITTNALRESWKQAEKIADLQMDAAGIAAIKTYFR